MTIMPDNPSKQPKIYKSAVADRDDDFWLEQANKLIIDSIAAVKSATSALMTGLGALQGIYLGVLGFAKLVPETASLRMRALFIIPLLCWMLALYQCLKVVRTEALRFHRHSPGEVREKLVEMAGHKQRQLERAFYLMLGGLLVAFFLILFRVNM